jgi:hypothetical protein
MTSSDGGEKRKIGAALMRMNVQKGSFVATQRLDEERFLSFPT